MPIVQDNNNHGTSFSIHVEQGLWEPACSEFPAQFCNYNLSSDCLSFFHYHGHGLQAESDGTVKGHRLKVVRGDIYLGRS